MFAGFIAWVVGKLVSLKTIFMAIVAVIVVGAIGFTGWHVYESIQTSAYNAGVASQSKIIAAMKAEVASANKEVVAQTLKAHDAKVELAAYVDKYNAYVRKTAAENAQLKSHQKQIEDTLYRNISTLRTKLKQVNAELINDLPTLVPPTGSSLCQLPTGLILLYNASISGVDPTGGLSLPASPSTNAFAASGVSCDSFARYFINNNVAAYHNRQSVIFWQTWYTLNQGAVKGIPTPPSALITGMLAPFSSGNQRSNTDGKFKVLLGLGTPGFLPAAHRAHFADSTPVSNRLNNLDSQLSHRRLTLERHSDSVGSGGLLLDSGSVLPGNSLPDFTDVQGRP